MSIISLDKKIIDAVNLASKYPTIRRIGVFGSFAKGDNDKHSDIDLLYDYDEDSEVSTDNLLDYVDEIDSLIKQAANVEKIDYVWYKGVLNSENEKLRQSVLDNVVWLYEKKQ